MDDIYGFPVFLESPRPLEEVKKRVESYFRVRRRSGGGDCGELTRVRENTYRICFREEREQQEVLRRSLHLVQLQDGSVEVRARSRCDLTTCPEEEPEPEETSEDKEAVKGAAAAAAAAAATAAATAATAASARGDVHVGSDLGTVEEQEILASSQEELRWKKETQDDRELKIVLLGKTGVGKSSLGNTIFGEEVFDAVLSANSVTRECGVQTRAVGGRNVTIIDTPGIFDSDGPEEDLKSGLAHCVTLCSPGVHAFLILLRVDRFTEQEKQVLAEIRATLSAGALKHSVLVFTHGNDLNDTGAEEFVSQNEELRVLVQECGGRYHVVDNRRWTGENRVDDLLGMVEEMVRQNSGKLYTNEMLQEVEKLIQEEEEAIQVASTNMSPKESRREAQRKVYTFLKTATGVTTGVLVGALLGVPLAVGKVVNLTFGKHPPAGLLLGATGFLKQMPGAEEHLKKMDAVAEGIQSVTAAAGGVAEIAEAADRMCKEGAAAGYAAHVRAAAKGLMTVSTAAEPVKSMLVANPMAAVVTVGSLATVGAFTGAATGYQEAERADSITGTAANTARGLLRSTLEPFRNLSSKRQEGETDAVTLSPSLT